MWLHSYWLSYFHSYSAFPSDRIPRVTNDVNIHFFIHSSNSCKLYRPIPGTFWICYMTKTKRTVREELCTADISHFTAVSFHYLCGGKIKYWKTSVRAIVSVLSEVTVCTSYTCWVININVELEVKATFTVEQAMKAQEEQQRYAVPFL